MEKLIFEQAKKLVKVFNINSMVLYLNRESLEDGSLIDLKFYLELLNKFIVVHSYMGVHCSATRLEGVEAAYNNILNVVGDLIAGNCNLYVLPVSLWERDKDFYFRNQIYVLGLESGRLKGDELLERVYPYKINFDINDLKKLRN